VNLEEKVRAIVFDNLPAIEDDEGGAMAARYVDDTTKDLMTMLRKGAYV
jgi:hypothetical protein